MVTDFSFPLLFHPSGGSDDVLCPLNKDRVWQTISPTMQLCSCFHSRHMCYLNKDWTAGRQNCIMDTGQHIAAKHPGAGGDQSRAKRDKILDSKRSVKIIINLKGDMKMNSATYQPVLTRKTYQEVDISVPENKTHIHIVLQGKALFKIKQEAGFILKLPFPSGARPSYG